MDAVHSPAAAAELGHHHSGSALGYAARACAPAVSAAAKVGLDAGVYSLPEVVHHELVRLAGAAVAAGAVRAVEGPLVAEAES